VRIGVIVLLATQVVNLALVPWLAHAGLAWSISIGALANCAFLLKGLHSRGIYSPGPQWRAFAARLGLALAGLAAGLFLIQRYFPYAAFSPGTLLMRVLWLSAAVGGAGALYGALLIAMGFRPRDFVLRAR